MSTIVLSHGGLGAEMDADRFWVRPGVVAACVMDAELVTLMMPVAVLPSVPPNRFHQRSTVDALLVGRPVRGLTRAAGRRWPGAR